MHRMMGCRDKTAGTGRLEGTMGVRFWMRGWLAGVMVGLVVLALFSAPVRAQGTRLWSIGRYDELERGTLDGVAVGNSGVLMAGPSVERLGDIAQAASGASYVWSVAAGEGGTTWAGLGGSSAGSAVVVRVGRDGKTAKLFAGKELGVQAVLAGPDGSVFAATAPDGKLYRIDASGSSTVIFDPAQTAEKPKYLWALARSGNQLFVAAGAPAAVYVIDLATERAGNAAAPAKLLFKTQDLHVRCLSIAPEGSLWAGTDGSGVVYRVAASNGRITAPARPIAVYASDRREITALAIAPDGTAYTSSVGARGVTGTALPPLPVTGQIGVTVTFSQPGAAGAAVNPVVPDGTEIDRIAPDGTPSHLAVLKSDVVYALALRGGALYAATGNRGHLYRIKTGEAERYADVAHLESPVVSAMVASPDGLLLGTSNGVGLYRASDARSKTATYTSEVFDAQQFSAWGRVEAQYPAPLIGKAAGFVLSVRTGNVPNPIEGWSDWVHVEPNGSGATHIPAGRFAQWRVEFPAGSSAALSSVGLNYLPRNVAPVVDEVAVQPGARVPPGPAAGMPSPNQSVQVLLPKVGAAATMPTFLPFTPQANDAGPLTGQKDRFATTVRWSAHDDNGDEMRFSLWYRGADESTWRLLKDDISDHYYSFDSSLLPDGTYTMQVRASDAPDHTAADTRTSERESDAFTLDDTPPVPGVLTAQLVPAGGAAAAQPAKMHIVFSARDALSPIDRAEYSIDAEPWQFCDPVGHLSDSLEEHYDFTAALPAGDSANGEHVVAMRIYDRFENVASVKTVVR
jgi:hypothetical protein